MLISSKAMKAACLLSMLSHGLAFTISFNTKSLVVSTTMLSMGYLDDLSPSQPDNDKEKPAPPPNNPSGGLIPSGRGPLGSYLDAVSSGTTTAASTNNSNDQDDDDDNNNGESSETIAYQPLPKPASWTNSYLMDFLTDDDPRTDIRNLLTQRSIQSFMRLLEECRDPHSAKCKNVVFLLLYNEP